MKSAWTWQESCKQRGPGKDFQLQLTLWRGCAKSAHKRFSQPPLILIMFKFLFCWLAQHATRKCSAGSGTVDGGGTLKIPTFFFAPGCWDDIFFSVHAVRYGRARDSTAQS